VARRAKVVWAEPALADLDDIAAWIAVDSPQAAADLVSRVMDATDRLQSFPRSGRRLPELPIERYRELIVPPLRVIYRAEGKQVLIVHVVRGER
jgi:toxin ParE1/3/4